MIIASLHLEIYLRGAHSLKDKRSAVKSVLQRLRNEFNVSTAEVGQQDRWQIAELGVVCVSSDGRYAQELLQAVVEWLYEHRPDLEISHAEIELV